MWERGKCLCYQIVTICSLARGVVCNHKVDAQCPLGVATRRKRSSFEALEAFLRVATNLATGGLRILRGSGRKKPRLDASRLRRLREEGWSLRRIAQALGIGASTTFHLCRD